jgi:thymidylate kinase
MVAELIDAAAAGRVLVVGSPPPHGRDLDVLAGEPELARIAGRLAAEGFVRRGDAWARFGGGSVDEVDLLPAAAWGLSDVELDRLLREASLLEGYAHLVTPSPPDDLLVLAKLLDLSGAVPAKRRERLRRAAEAPGAWARAEELAPGWGLEQALARLHAAAAGAPPPRTLPRPYRLRVVALSGIDGSGKSTQARALCETLERLGYDAVVAWMPLAHNAWLERLARPMKRALARSPRRRAGLAPAPQGETGLHQDVGTELRDRSPLVSLAWTLLVALANASFHLRAAAVDGVRGRVVVFDRYLLDTAARFRFQYGAERRFPVQNALVRMLSPRPLASFWLDVDAATSFARKDDLWTLADLGTQARLYREEAERLDVIRLDGRRPQEELAAEIAETVWRRLA